MTVAYDPEADSIGSYECAIAELRRRALMRERLRIVRCVAWRVRA